MATKFLLITITHLPFYPFTRLLIYLFTQNKANLLNAQMNVSAFITNDYENNRLVELRENKPKTNPTCRGVASGEAGSNFLLWEVVRRKLAKSVDYPQRRIHNDRQILTACLPQARSSDKFRECKYYDNKRRNP